MQPKKKLIDFTIVVSLLIPGLLTVVGWYVASRLESDRDARNKARDGKNRTF